MAQPKNQCPACLGLAQEMALENWLDDKKLRWKNPDDPTGMGYLYDPATVDEAEVEYWAQAMMENDVPEMGWHENFDHPGPP